MVDGPRERPAEGAVRAHGAPDVLQGAASTGAGHAPREVVVPMPSREDLGTAHTEPPLDRVTLARRQPDPA